MRILVTADLHYNIARSQEPARLLARQTCDEGGDALVLVGDSAAAELGPLRQCLRLFADFPGRKFLVLGNHSLWCRGPEDSLDRYHRVLPQTAAEEGFHLLDESPAVLGDLALVGSVGWYDYSFRDRSLGIPEAFYLLAQCPKVSHVFCGHSHWPAEAKVGKMSVVNVGSTYTQKELKVLDL
jgi:predicted phosphodiesterase